MPLDRSTYAQLKGDFARRIFDRIYLAFEKRAKEYPDLEVSLAVAIGAVAASLDEVLPLTSALDDRIRALEEHATRPEKHHA